MLARIAQHISAHGGWLPFARYMELALYEPGIGYYAGGARKFGAAGDFVTAPELGSLFARTLARQLAELSLPILEFGAGSGALAEALLNEHPFEYAILEPSAELRERQRHRLGTRVKFLHALPKTIRGVVLANEVLDAMPVHAVAWRDAGIMERGVNASLHWEERPARGEVLAEAHKIDVPVPYESELGLAGRAWMRSIGERLESGVVFIIDYGFPQHEYYHPQRSSGTLMCHYQHRAHADPFAHPGEEDITAHVDFSAVAAAAREVGLDVLGYATQAQFLINCGITEVLSQVPSSDVSHYAPLAAQAQKLLSPAEMGELFKVLAVGHKPAITPLMGFARGERSHAL
jgi:SAM-dependent MidA family methyltransferase